MYIAAGGIADTTTDRTWDEDTLVLVYSTTKGITAMCANRLAQQGAIDVEAPAATYWPEFAQAGKENVTVAELLSHRAGLAWVDGSLSFEQALAWNRLSSSSIRRPRPPGSAHGYHATTFGWLVGEVVRRVSGKTLGTYFHDEIAGPLGAQFFVGLPASEEDRVARLISFLESLEAGGSLQDLTAGGGSLSGLEGLEAGSEAASYLLLTAPD